MKKVLIFGTGRRGRQILLQLKFDYDVIGFVDNRYEGGDSKLEIDGLKYSVYSPSDLKNLEFDKIFLGTFERDEALDILDKVGIKDGVIDKEYGHFSVRVDFLSSLSSIFQKNNICGSVAEIGVYKGEFAKYINLLFPKSKFYLLDSFEGFSENDCKIDKDMGFSNSVSTDFSDTSIKLVKSKLTNLDKCYFIKGYFPDTAKELPQDEKFCFVNLDTDLYAPIKEGCEFFYPRLVGGGVLLVDDYFHLRYTGVREAVDEFAKNNGIVPMPIGDGKDAFLLKI